MTSPRIELSVIIVNWHSAEYLQKCLESIRAHTTGVSYEIIVVDNASFDTADQVVRQFSPQKARFIQLDENRGFAAANNAGFAAACGGVVCYLNPDTELTANVFAVMLDILKNDERIGVAGCRLLNSDHSLQTSCVLPYPTIMNQILDIEWLKRRTPQWRLWGTAALASAEGSLPQEVEAVSGACMVVPRRVVDATGGFCEDYFMYSEDVDLCYRARQAGYKVVYCGGAEIIHHGGKSADHAKQSRFSTVQMREAIACYFEKHKTKTYSAAYKGLLFVSALLRLLVLALGAPVLVFTSRRRLMKAAAVKWTWVAQWSMGLKQDGAVL